MKHIILALAVLAIVPSAYAAKKPPNVVIPKPLPVQPEGAMIFLAPPLLIFYDLNRRINCLNPPDPFGLGGPGFDGKPMPPGNIMTPCYLRSGAKPK